MKLQKLLARFLAWRVKNLKHKQYVFILSLLVGVFAGVGATIIKKSVHGIKHLLTGAHTGGAHHYFYFAYPLLGILLAVLFIRFILRSNIGHGIPSTLYAISKKNSIMKRHNMFSSVITAAFTVGCGGSAGLEGPTVATGSSIGSNIAQLLRLDYKTTTLLLGCGAAGAMSGIFGAPVAAIVFAIEVIMLDLTVASLVPLLIASISSAVTAKVLTGDGLLFPVHLNREYLNAEFINGEIFYFIILGIIAGLMSVYFSKMYWWVEKQFSRFDNIYAKLITGGVVLGILIFLVPPLYGEGYETIEHLLNGTGDNVFKDSLLFGHLKEDIWVILIGIFIMILLKVIATSITFGAGGVGGIFAPTLFMGSSVGFLFAKSINTFFGTNLRESHFALAGMGGMISGVLHAPLTAMFLIAEITGGYELLLPLMIAVTVSYMTIKYFVPHSVYTMQLAKRGELITHNKDKAILTLMNLKSEIETDFRVLKGGMTLRNVVREVEISSRNLFPVLTDEGELQGVVTLDDIREIMFKPEMYDKVAVESVMTEVLDTATTDDSMDDVMKKFNETGYWNLPVVDNEGKYLGFVSKSKLFTAYRKMLIHFSED